MDQVATLPRASAPAFGAPASGALRGDYARMARDYVVPQRWAAYTEAEHDRWRRLYQRQVEAAAAHASDVFLHGLDAVACGDGVPSLAKTNRSLRRATGWSLVAVPGLIPNDAFFAHLAARRFPVTRWIREEAELDYIVEPDIFHDFFGHVPMLFEPAFAEAMQAYGALGLEAGEATRTRLARLYWYVVEFGLEARPDGLKAFGAGILSSAAETVFAVTDPRPNRVAFDLRRVLRTTYRIDAFQQTYFVLDRFEDLLEAVDHRFDDTVATLMGSPDVGPDQVLRRDRLVGLGARFGRLAG